MAKVTSWLKSYYERLPAYVGAAFKTYDVARYGSGGWRQDWDVIIGGSPRSRDLDLGFALRAKKSCLYYRLSVRMVRRRCK